MSTFHATLNSTGTSHHFGFPLLGFILVSIAIHLILFLSNQMNLGQPDGGSSTIQVYMSGGQGSQKSSTIPTPEKEATLQKSEHKIEIEKKPASINKTATQAIDATATVTNQQQIVSTANKIPISAQDSEQGETAKPQHQATNTTIASEPPVTTTQVTPPISHEQSAMASSNSNTHERDKITQQLQQALARHFNYPFLARRRGWQGEVTIAFTLESDGRIMDIRIANSSGHSMLDRAALASLNKVGLIEYAPYSALYFELPVIYRLEG